MHYELIGELVPHGRDIRTYFVKLELFPFVLRLGQMVGNKQWKGVSTKHNNLKSPLKQVRVT
jgi:hypothetical protein